MFSFFKISLLMAKCQKSENFLSELQQAFLQAKRSVQEQMVSQVNCRDHEQPCLSEPGSSVCLSKALCAQPGLSISTCKGPGPVSCGGSAGAGSVVSFCAAVCVPAHSGAGRSLPSSFPLIHCPIPCLCYLSFTSNLKTEDFLKALF